MEILSALTDAIQSGFPVALCTIVETLGAVPRHAGTKMVVFGDGKTLGTVGGGEVESLVREEALTALQDGKTRLLSYHLDNIEKGDPGICGGRLSIYVEPYLQAATVVVVGAGHVGKAVAHLAKWLGYRVVVSDDRSELCTSDVVPEADEYLPFPMSQIPERIAVDSQTYLVLVTRGVSVDLEGIPALINSDAAYIGLIGSRKRWAHCRKELLAAGLTKDELERIKSPIGINIHAETPEEIALSIMAEITTRRNAENKNPKNNNDGVD